MTPPRRRRTKWRVLSGRRGEEGGGKADRVVFRTLLDVVVSQGAAILELLASEDQTLLIRRDALLILDLLLDLLDRVGALNLKGDGFTSQSLDKDLHI